MKKYVSLMLVIFLSLTGFLLAQDKKPATQTTQTQAQAAPEKTPEQLAAEQSMALIKKIQENPNNPQEQVAAAEAAACGMMKIHGPATGPAITSAPAACGGS